MNEHELQQRLLIALGRRPDMRVWRSNSGKVPVKDDRGNVLRVFSAGTPPGYADISGVVAPHGRLLQIEVKAARGRMRPDQERWRDVVTALGGIYLLARVDPTLSAEENVASVVSLLEQELGRVSR